MIIKQFLMEGLDLKIMQLQGHSKYEIIKNIEGQRPEYHQMKDLESALDLFDIWLNGENYESI